MAHRRDPDRRPVLEATQELAFDEIARHRRGHPARAVGTGAGHRADAGVVPPGAGRRRRGSLLRAEGRRDGSRARASSTWRARPPRYESVDTLEEYRGRAARVCFEPRPKRGRPVRRSCSCSPTRRTGRGTSTGASASTTWAQAPSSRDGRTTPQPAARNPRTPSRRRLPSSPDVLDRSRPRARDPRFPRQSDRRGRGAARRRRDSGARACPQRRLHRRARGARAARRRAEPLRRQGRAAARRERQRRDRGGARRDRRARPARRRSRAARARRHAEQVEARRERDPRRLDRGREGGRGGAGPAALPLPRRPERRTCCPCR